MATYTGTVKWFHEEKGYGFIHCEELQRDIFVHHSGINMRGFRKLAEGDEVQFEIGDTERGPKAVNVARL